MRCLVAMCFCALTLLAGTGAFTVEEQGDGFRVLHRGRVLLDSVKAVGQKDGGLGREPKASSGVLADGTRVWNRWSEHPDTRIRLEVALKGDGSEVEITMIGTCFHYAEERARLLELSMPWEAVAGCAYEGVQGNGRNWRPAKGDLKQLPKEGDKVGGDTWRYLCFQGGKGAASGVVFDFNPLGAGDYMSSYASGSIRGVFTLWREGEKARLRGGIVLDARPGDTGAKLVLREGEFAGDYPTHHAWKDFRYLHRLATARLYSFGAKKHGKMYQSADGLRYNAKRGFGWLGKPEVSAVQAAPEGALYSAMTGRDAVFRIGNLPPGLHILIVQAGNFGGAPNRFAVSANGRPLVAAQSVAKGELLAVAVPVWVGKTGVVDIRFDGEFLVSAIGTGFLMAEAEDFTYQRGYWVSAGYEPSIVFRNSCARPDANLAVSVERMPMPIPGEEAKGPLKRVQRPRARHEPDSPGLSWTKTAILGRMGTLCDHMEEFCTDSDMARHLDTLKANGVNTVMVAGMHSRHTYPEHIERGIQAVARMAKAARARGMKVIDHHEATLLWQENVGFRTMAERLPETARALPDMMPGPAFCMTNPVFTRKERDYLLRLIRESGIDGLQCDELYYFPYFCGCAHCRKAFHEETGWWIPMNELDPRLMNRQAPLWKAYLNWRMEKLVDWMVDFRREADQVNPNLVVMYYTTHHGFSSVWASLEKGNDLVEAQRGANWFGTEIMPRNCLQNERPLVPYRKMYNLLRETMGLPLWGILYGYSHSAFYFGWAANNLAAGRSFMLRDFKPGEVNFLAFGAGAENMDVATVKPQAQVALLFSRASRDWNPRGVTMAHENMGIAQTLEELHIPYRILAEHLLTEERLKQFKALIVGGAGAMSDATVAALVRFAEQGGTVYLTSVAATADELGNPREAWPFARYFDCEPKAPCSPAPLRIGPDAKRAAAVARPLRRWRVSGKGRAPAQSPLWAFDEKGGAIPLVYEAKVGRGRLVYQSCALGAPLFCDEVAPINGVWKFELDEGLARVYRAFLADLLRGASPWRVKAPLKVHTELYRQGDAYVAHFLNGQGDTMKPGDRIVAELPGDPWPPLAEDIVFTLDAPQVREAYAVSPDFPGRKPLALVRDGRNVTVTLPKALLKAYTLVWMR